ISWSASSNICDYIINVLTITGITRSHRPRDVLHESPVVTIIETVTSVALCDSREPPAHGTKIYGYVSTRRSTCLCARSDPCISYSIDFSSRLLTDTSFEVLVLNLYSSVKELSSIGNRVVVDLIDLAFTSLWSICTSRIIEVRLLVLTLVVWVKGIRYVSHFFLSQLFLPKALLLLEVVEIGFR